MNQKKFFNWGEGFLKTSFTLLLLLVLSFSFVGDGFFSANAVPRKSVLAQGDAVLDPESILRSALPINDQNARNLQSSVEKIAYDLRTKRWGAVAKDGKDAAFILSFHRNDLIEAVPEGDQATATALVDEIKKEVDQLQEVIPTKDKQQILAIREQILAHVTAIEELMVTGFPFEIPTEYANLPQLKGRATVEIETTKGLLTLVVDGYSAPVNAGNFVDLVQRKFYDGLRFTRAEDFYVLQTGDPEGDAEGFIDPKTKEYRAIPLEVLVKGDSEPIYGVTLEDAGLYLEQPALPFNAYGAVALARPGNDPNGGSSQFFFFKFDRELTPPGYNVLDGRYSVFGYLVEGKEVLGELTAEDKIIQAKVTKGLENLVQPTI
jgi:peptidylprolyl isomerase